MGARCRRCAAARSTARSARSGGPTASSRGSGSVDAVVREIVELAGAGFRFIALADDNFYPVTLEDLAAWRSAGATRHSSQQLKALRAERFELMAQLAQLPDDMVFFTQITMEAAEDPEFLDAMRRAHIHGALVGVESVTPEGLKAIYKDFNDAGEALVDAAAGVQAARRPRARLVHLRTAERLAVHVRRDGRSRAARRRDVRAVRDADAVSGHARFRQVGDEKRRTVRSVDGIPLTRTG